MSKRRQLQFKIACFRRDLSSAAVFFRVVVPVDDALEEEDVASSSVIFHKPNPRTGISGILKVVVHLAVVLLFAALVPVPPLLSPVSNSCAFTNFSKTPATSISTFPDGLLNSFKTCIIFFFKPAKFSCSFCGSFRDKSRDKICHRCWNCGTAFSQSRYSVQKYRTRTNRIHALQISFSG